MNRIFFLHSCLGSFNNLYADVVINVFISKKRTAYCMLLKVSLYARCYFQRSQYIDRNTRSKKNEYSSVCYVKVITVPFDVFDIYLLLCKNVKEEIVEVFGMVSLIQH